MSITQEQAQVILRETLAHGRAEKLAPLAVVVMDAGGNLVAALREDGCPAGRIRVAEGKAHGVAMLGMAGSAMRARASENGAGAAFIAAANGLFGGRLVPVPGGVLIRDSERRICGAVGVSGDISENDAAAAKAGIEAAGLVAEV